MAPITLLEPPAYTEDERRALIDFVVALKKAYIQDFLRQIELPRSGTKPDLRERLQEALDNGRLTYERLIEFLDSVAPWGKQHVFLFTGPRTDLQPWKDPGHVQCLLKQHRIGKFFNAKLPLILPDKLALSSITHADGTLRVTAIQKRDYTERAPEHDDQKEIQNGSTVILKAYMKHISRTLVAFEWNLNANIAMLQITQLQKETLYEEVAKEFFALVAGWLDIRQFGPVDIRKAIRKLHELEGNGQAEARSHKIDYRTLQGRVVSGRSPSPRDSVLGEADVDQAMARVAKKSVGHLGNFYWLASTNGNPVPNPLNGDVHVIIVGDKSRVNFPVPTSEDVVRYVLHRVRALS